MKLDKVYIGYVKGDRERILYEKYSTYDNGLRYKVFVDLDTERVFDAIDIEYLISANVALNILQDRMTRRKLLKLYRLDRRKLLDINGIYFGDLVRVDVFNDGDKEIVIEDKVSSNSLFARFNDPYGRSMNLITSRKFFRAERVSSGIAVRETRAIDNSTFEDVMVPKKKILRKYYENKL